MLGRSVNDHARALSPEYVWGDTLPLLRQADLRAINLECVIAAPETGSEWRPKVFHFKAEPWAIDALKAAAIDVVGLANNHVLDYGHDALLEMLIRLDEAGIAHAGAGLSLSEAAAPAFVEADGVRLAFLALTDNEPGWEAARQRVQDLRRSAGIFYAPVRVEGDRFEILRRAIAWARANADIVIVSAHAGPHFREAPDARDVQFARAIIDAGAGVYMGTSNHSFQGVEAYRGGMILYDLGDFVDDYAVDPVFRNDRSFLIMLDFAGPDLKSISLHPTEIKRMQVTLAGEEAAEWSLARMEKLSRDLGTQLVRSGGILKLEL